MNWDRQLWGVEFIAPREKPTMIGTAWNYRIAKAYDGEPPRALLFTTRSTAREWCDKKNAEYRARSDFVRHWRMRVVRVRETVRRVK